MQQEMRNFRMGFSDVSLRCLFQAESDSESKRWKSDHVTFPWAAATVLLGDFDHMMGALL